LIIRDAELLADEAKEPIVRRLEVYGGRHGGVRYVLKIDLGLRPWRKGARECFEVAPFKRSCCAASMGYKVRAIFDCSR
jgi:hypothetical protein